MVSSNSIIDDIDGKNVSVEESNKDLSFFELLFKIKPKNFKKL